MFPELTSIELWVVSNGIGAVAFALLTLFLVLIEPHHSAVRPLAAACGVNTLWLGLLAAAPLIGAGGPVLDLAETTRNGMWLVLASSLLPSFPGRATRPLLIGVALGLPLLLLVYLAWRLASTSVVGSPMSGHSFLFAVGATLTSFWALVLVEQTWRVGGTDRRWAIKYLCLALMTLFVYDFLMYSFALVYAHIDINVWDARGAVNALAAPMIAIAAMRHASWSARVGMSHQAVFRSGTVLAVGVYLVIVALGSYYIRRFGGSWGSVAAVFFLAATTIGLFVLLASAQIRAHMRVFINKHLFSYKYDYREEWLALTRRLSHQEAGVDPYGRAIRAVAQLLDSPAGALWLDRDDRFVVVAEWNLLKAMEIELPVDSELATFLHENGWIVDFRESGNVSAAASALALTRAFRELPRARLLLPLFAEERLLGFMVLAEPRAQYRLGWEELDLLKTLGRQVGVFLDQQESNQALTQARQFEAFNQLTAFLMHDLKNIAGQQSLILQNAERHKHNPAFVDDMILTVENSVARMQEVLRQLERVSAGPRQGGRVAIDALVTEILDNLAGTSPVPERQDDGCEAIVIADRERFAMVLRHVIKNAQDATGRDGWVGIRATVEAGTVAIAVSDNGEGMTPAFIRDSLFKPFFSTKSARGMGIGAYQARDFARGAGGDVTVDSTPGVGTVFTLRLPAAESEHGRNGELNGDTGGPQQS